MSTPPLDGGLRYLAQLTAAGLKPLSRWEGPCDPHLPVALEPYGLQCRTIPRTVRSGRVVTELVFSPDARCLDLYARRFQGRPLDLTSDDRRVEGWLFGYPSCCVESYLSHGYRPNALRRRDQRLLFHWACPHCALSPLLLPHYRHIRRAQGMASPGGARSEPRCAPPSLAIRRGLCQGVAMAASLVALGGLPLLAWAGAPPDPHQIPFREHGGFTYAGSVHQGRLNVPLLRTTLQSDPHQTPVSPDQDGDLLTDREELDLKTNPVDADENANRVPDGVDLAVSYAARIAELPRKPSAEHPYRLDFELKGLEQCAVCGTAVNMGHLTVCHPRADLYAEVHYIALHHLDHGSLSYAGDVHGAGRLDPVLLRAALDATSPSHFLPAAEDADKDGLSDAEEKHFGTDPTRPDTDANGVPDGFTVARVLWASVVGLTRDPGAPVHAVDHLLRGLVTCPVCGIQENMGYVELVNRHEQMSVEVTYLALHFLRHGSLANGAGQRLNPRRIDFALSGDGTSHLTIVGGDTDRDGLLDPEEVALGFESGQPDTNRDGVLDGLEAARSAFRRIQELPRQPQTDQAYALHAEADCYKPCEVCGLDVNCGHVELVQPWADLRTRLSYRLLHFLEHGSFAASSDERADPLRLEAFLRPSLLVLGHGSPDTFRWYGTLGRRYEVQSADTPSGPWRPGPTFTGADAPLTFAAATGDPRPRRFYRLSVW